jgi:hypothetical protein
MLNFMALYWPQGLKKGYHRIWEVNFQALGRNNEPKMLKVGPQVFSALTPSVKWTLGYWFISPSKCVAI